MIIGIRGVVSFHQGEIQFPLVQLLEQFPGVAEDQGQFHIRMGLQIPGSRTGNAVFPNGHGHAEGQLPGPPLAGFHLPGKQGLIGLEQPGISGQGPAGRGQFQRPAPVAEKGQAVFLFQPMDMMGNGRLGQEQFPGRLGEVHGFTDRKKSTQLGIH